MTRLRFMIATLVLAPALSALAVDQSMDNEQRHEVTTASSLISFGGGRAFSANLSAGYHNRLPNLLDGNIQLGALFDTLLTEPLKTYTVLVGPTFNYKAAAAPTLENALFLSVMGGLGITNIPSNTDTEFAYRISLGKRFALNNTVSWRPEAALGKSGSFSPTKTSFQIIPLQFSFFWG